MIGITGLAVDYGLQMAVKAKLDQAAAVASVTGAQTYLTSYKGSSDVTTQATASGQAQGMSQFYANAGKLPSGTLATPSVAVTRSNSTLTSKVNYSFSMPTYFMSALGIRTSTVKGTSTSTLTMPTYVNIYIVIDISSSMGIGATSTDQQIVYTATGGCVVTCHYDGSTTTARLAGATLRIDVAKNAVMSALSKLPSNSTYQVAVYTMSDKFTNVFALSNNITNANLAISGVDLTGSNSDGGTDTTYALKSLASQLPTPGAGMTQATAQGIVMLITDAVQDSDMKVLSHGSYVDQNDPAFTVLSPCNQSTCTFDSDFGVYFESFDPTQCSPIKTAGYTMMTLDIQYLIPPSNLQGGNAALQGAFSYIQNYLLKSIPGNMSACATSSGYAYNANTPAEITSAVAAIVAAIPAAAQARLSQ